MCLPWLRDSEGGVGGNCGVLTRVRWVACKRKWHAIISAIAIYYPEEKKFKCFLSKQK